MTAAPATDRLASLTGLRAVAAYGVVLTHVGFQTGRAIDPGSFFAPFLARLDFGVTLFFLLSGFLLSTPFLAAVDGRRPRPRIRAYLARRMTRVWPAYLLAVSATFVVLSRDAPAEQVLAYLTMTQPFLDVPADRALTQMWTLPTEVSFYLVLPVLAAAALRGRTPGDPPDVLRRTLVMAALLALVAWTWSTACLLGLGPGRAGLLWLPAYLDWFAGGMVLAALRVRAAGGAELGSLVQDVLALARSSVACWLAAAAVFVLATRAIAGPLDLTPTTPGQWATKHLLYLLTALLVLLPCALGGVDGRPADDRVQRVLSHRVAVWLGEISYGVYLWHLLVMFVLVARWDLDLFQGGFVQLLAGTLVGATALAAASYVLLERPLIAAVHRRTARAAGDTGSTVATATATQTRT